MARFAGNQYRCRTDRIAIVVISTITVLASLTLCLTMRYRGSGLYHKAAVATDYGPCSEMGKDILQIGGSAVDAAITASFCLAVTNPQSSGMGGGFFMVVYDSKAQTTTSLLANEVAPAASTYDMFEEDELDSYNGARSIAVPTQVAGLWEAHQAYGILPWMALFEPVISIAENGFRISEHWGNALHKEIELGFDPEHKLRDQYRKSDGSFPQTGDIVTAPENLVRTLRAIAVGGAAAFHGGEIGKMLVQDIREEGGILTEDDIALTNFNITWWHQTSVFDLKDGQGQVLSTPNWSAGNLMQYIINILSECNLANVDFSTFEGKLKMYHYFIEASSFAKGLTQHVGYNITDEGRRALKEILSEDYGRHICSMINEKFATYSLYSYDTFSHILPPASVEYGPAVKLDRGADEPREKYADTTHMSVLSEDGVAVSMTSSIGSYFGAKIFSNRTGMFVNNHMGLFAFNKGNGSFRPRTVNDLAPGARSTSTISPTIVTSSDGSIHQIIGSSGGNAIPSVNAWTILQMLWKNGDIESIIEDPRLYVFPDVKDSFIYHEHNFPQDLVKSLHAMGHNMQLNISIAVVQSIVRNNEGLLHAHCDQRKKGYPAGY